VSGTAIVPVMPLGTGLTGVETPGAKPFVPTGALGSVPSEEVTPSGGMAVPTWANAGPPHNRGKVAATIKNGLMENSPIRASGLCSERPQAAQLVSRRDRIRSFSLPLTEDELSEQTRRDRRSGDPSVPGANIP
jgi:hypothetical protein